MGQDDVAVDVSSVSIHLSIPQRGHLDQAFNISAYLKGQP